MSNTSTTEEMSQNFVNDDAEAFINRVKPFDLFVLNEYDKIITDSEFTDLCHSWYKSYDLSDENNGEFLECENDDEFLDDESYDELLDNMSEEELQREVKKIVKMMNFFSKNK